MQVEIVDAGPGRREAVKRACDAGDAARLRREADLLNVASHPGLVEAIDFEDGSEPVLRTLYVGEALSGLEPLAVEEVAGVVAAVATTLADLHAVGLVHGAVLPSHVLIDADGRPVLCGLGSGGLVGERPPWSRARPGTGEVNTDEGTLTPAADVVALGNLVEFLLAGVPSTDMGAATEELRRIAEQAGASDDDRPTARQVAAAVHDSVPGARLPRRSSTQGTAQRVGPSARLDAGATSRSRRPLERWRKAQRLQSAPDGSRRSKRSTWAALFVAIAAVAGAGILLRPTPPGPAEPEPFVLPGPTAVAGTVVEGTTTTLAPAGLRPHRPARQGCPAVDGPMTADVDGDGCAEVVRFARGVAEAAGTTWAVGEAGDVAAVGDWSCSGVRSLALLRPRTGEIFAFSGWATAMQDLVAPLVAQVSGGRALRTADFDADGCDELVVERSSESPAVVRPRTAAPPRSAVP